MHEPKASALRNRERYRSTLCGSTLCGLVRSDDAITLSIT